MESKTLPLESFFDYGHLPKSTSMAQLLILLAWCPFGFALLIARFIALLCIIALTCIVPPSALPHSLILLAPIWGIVVRTSGAPPATQAPLIIASNHITAVDVFPYMLQGPLHVLVDKGFFESSQLARFFFNVVRAIPLDRTHVEPEKKATVRDNIVGHLQNSKLPLLFFPEGWDTNGKVGLLLYQKFLFSMAIPIQPVAMRVRVGGLPLTPGMLGTSVLKEVAWLFFSPYWVWELHYMKVQVKQADENEIEFALRVQKATAQHLGIVASTYTYKDALRLRRSLIQGKEKKL